MSEVAPAAERLDPALDPESVFRLHHIKMWRSLAASFGSEFIADEAVAEAFAQLIRRGDGVSRPDR